MAVVGGRGEASQVGSGRSLEGFVESGRRKQGHQFLDHDSLHSLLNHVKSTLFETVLALGDGKWDEVAKPTYTVS